MSEDVSPGILSLFDLEALDEDTYIITAAPTIGRERLFGGQVAGQSLRAACLTVAGRRLPHSLHAYFIRPGRPGEELRFEVARTRDGRTFSTRHVTASQGGKPIFEMIGSFHDQEPGYDWQPPSEITGVRPPEELEPPEMPAFFRHPPGFDIRIVNRPAPGEFPMRHPFWIRTEKPVGDDLPLHACLIAYLSDMAIVSSARAPGSPRELAAAVSLDHALWFHRPARVDEWLLFSADSAGNHGARGLARGTLHSRDGTLVASLAQEALLRPAGAF